MLRRLIFSLVAGVLVALLASQILCDAPNPTLANPAYCGPRQWMTSVSAFLCGAGLMWVWLLRKSKAPPEPAADSPPDRE
jgi:hypothetical protein